MKRSIVIGYCSWIRFHIFDMVRGYSTREGFSCIMSCVFPSARFLKPPSTDVRWMYSILKIRNSAMWITESLSQRPRPRSWPTIPWLHIMLNQTPCPSASVSKAWSLCVYVAPRRNASLIQGKTRHTAIATTYSTWQDGWCQLKGFLNLTPANTSWFLSRLLSLGKVVRTFGRQHTLGEAF